MTRTRRVVRRPDRDEALLLEPLDIPFSGQPQQGVEVERFAERDQLESFTASGIKRTKPEADELSQLGVGRQGTVELPDAAVLAQRVVGQRHPDELAQHERAANAEPVQPLDSARRNLPAQNRFEQRGGACLVEWTDLDRQHVVAVREVAQRGRQIGCKPGNEDDLQALKVHKLAQNQAGKTVEQFRIVDEEQRDAVGSQRRGDRLAGLREQQPVLGRRLGASQKGTERGKWHFVR